MNCLQCHETVHNLSGRKGISTIVGIQVNNGHLWIKSTISNVHNKKGKIFVAVSICVPSFDDNDGGTVKYFLTLKHTLDQFWPKIHLSILKLIIINQWCLLFTPFYCVCSVTRRGTKSHQFSCLIVWTRSRRSGVIQYGKCPKL